MLQFYHSHLQSNLTKTAVGRDTEFLIFKILIDLLQIHQWVRLESLADKFPLPIKFESRRKKLQRFFSSEKLNIQNLWHPILEQIIATYYPLKKNVYLVIDRTRWANVNILMISLLYQKKCYPTLRAVVVNAARRVYVNGRQKGTTNYIGRTKEEQRNTRRHSRFYIGLHGREWR